MVEWKELGEVLSVHTGKQLNRSGLSEVGKCPVMNGGRTPSGYTDTHNENENSITISQGGESAGFVNWMNVAFWAGAHCYVVENTSDQNLRYLFHLLKNYEYKIMESKQGAGIPGLNRKNLYSINVPIPPLSEQNRIVGILDTFTESIENLKKQITERKKQYAYLIDQAFGGSLAEMKKKAEVGTIRIETLSSHGTFTRGRRFVRTDIIDNGQPCIHYGDMYTYYGLCADKAKTHLPYDFPKKMRYAKKGDVVIVAAGENNEDIGVGLVWQGEEPAAVHDACFIYESDFEPMFLSYFLRSSIYHLQIKSNVVRGKICSISSDGIGKALIPIYPIDKQKEIVENLYPYEKLFVNLQAQLELRQKQYEYYRNMLLTFDE